MSCWLFSSAVELLKTLGTAAHNGGKPFFIAAGFHRPHLPFTVPQSFLDLYPLQGVRMPDNDYAPVDMPEIGMLIPFVCDQNQSFCPSSRVSVFLILNSSFKLSTRAVAQYIDVFSMVRLRWATSLRWSKAVWLHARLDQHNLTRESGAWATSCILRRSQLHRSSNW